MFEKKTYTVPIEAVIPMGIDIKIRTNPFRIGEATFLGLSVYYMVNEEKRTATPTMVSLAKKELVGAVDGMLADGTINQAIAHAAREKIIGPFGTSE